jgi:hypothetical protein
MKRSRAVVATTTEVKTANPLIRFDATNRSLSTSSTYAGLVMRPPLATNVHPRVSRGQ